MALKLANFAALDPGYASAGMTRTSRGDVETWAIYAGDVDLLSAAAERIRAGEEPVFSQPTRDKVVRPSIHDVEQQRSPTFTVDHAEATVEAERREAMLVLRFAAWLRKSGCRVTAHHYPVTEPPLRGDLFDETADRLWEAKGVVSRTAIRTAIGQLQDYRRFESDSTRLGVLLPREPSEDLQRLLASVHAAMAWPTIVQTFEVIEPSE